MISHDLKLPKEIRGDLRELLGPIVTGYLPEKYHGHRPIITVGDVVTEVLVSQGITPDVAVIDYFTRRGEYSPDLNDEIKKLKLKNPQGYIMSDSWKMMKKAIEHPEPVIINVDGEEDLLSLVAIILCPNDGLVIYGVPSRGMVVNVSDEDKKKKARQVINRMNKVNEGG